MVGAPARARRAVVVAAAAAYAWWAAGLRPFTGPALVATLAGGAAAMVAGARWLPPRRPSQAPLAGWVVLAVAVAGWELAAFVQHPRPEHPTLSWLAEGVIDSHVVESVAFLGWLLGAAWLARPDEP